MAIAKSTPQHWELTLRPSPCLARTARPFRKRTLANAAVSSS